MCATQQPDGGPRPPPPRSRPRADRMASRSGGPGRRRGRRDPERQRGLVRERAEVGDADLRNGSASGVQGGSGTGARRGWRCASRKTTTSGSRLQPVSEFEEGWNLRVPETVARPRAARADSAGRARPAPGRRGGGGTSRRRLRAARQHAPQALVIEHVPPFLRAMTSSCASSRRIASSERRGCAPVARAGPSRRRSRAVGSRERCIRHARREHRQHPVRPAWAAREALPATAVDGEGQARRRRPQPGEA